jgi:hypothetical protein
MLLGDDATRFRGIRIRHASYIARASCVDSQVDFRVNSTLAHDLGALDSAGSTARSLRNYFPERICCRLWIAPGIQWGNAGGFAYEVSMCD